MFEQIGIVPITGQTRMYNLFVESNKAISSVQFFRSWLASVNGTNRACTYRNTHGYIGGCIEKLQRRRYFWQKDHEIKSVKKKKLGETAKWVERKKLKDMRKGEKKGKNSEKGMIKKWEVYIARKATGGQEREKRKQGKNWSEDWKRRAE